MADNLHAGHRERTRARFLETGGRGFSPHQRVELLLFYAIPRKDTNELAHLLINRFGSIDHLLNASYAELVQVKGMPPNAATLLCLIRRLNEEVQRERMTQDDVLTDTDAFRRYVQPLFIGAQTEQTVMVCLNSAGRVLGHEVLSVGSATAADVNIRQALRTAMHYDATTVVLAHNHSHGRAVPSREDATATMAIAKALSYGDVRVADHIIVAGEETTSMRDDPLFAPIFHRIYRHEG